MQALRLQNFQIAYLGALIYALTYIRKRVCSGKGLLELLELVEWQGVS
jgi:hypothetical protein